MPTDAATFQGQQPINADAVVHDAVVGDEITVWFATAAGPIGLRMGGDEARDLRARLDDLIDNLQ